MCGHALVYSKLVKKVVEDVKSARKTPDEAARMLGKPCVCGIVNLVRAAKMLDGLASKQRDDHLERGGIEFAAGSVEIRSRWLHALGSE